MIIARNLRLFFQIMKRIFVLICIVGVLAMESCTPVSLNTDLKTEIDTVSYFLGMSRAEGIEMYLEEAGVDTAYMDAFFKGFMEGIEKYSPEDVARLEGMRISQTINIQWIEEFNKNIFMDDSDYTINRKAVLWGFYTGVKSADKMELMRADTYSQLKIENLKTAYRESKFKDWIAKGETFLTENKNKEGVVTTASGLQYKIIEQGSSNVKPIETSVVKINYVGRFIDESEFGNTYRNEKPATVQVNKIIQGWTEALTMMNVGSKWELYVPYNLAYGAREQNDIPPYSVLIFEIELLEIVSL